MPNKIDALTNNDLDKIGNLLDSRLAPLATKTDLKGGLEATEIKVKEYINQGIETVMEGINNLSTQLAEKEKVDRLIVWAKKVSEKTGVGLEI